MTARTQYLKCKSAAHHCGRREEPASLAAAASLHGENVVERPSNGTWSEALNETEAQRANADALDAATDLLRDRF